MLLLNGCLQNTALLGPGITVAQSGNISLASFQYATNKAVHNETGKNTIQLVKDTVVKKQKQFSNKKFSDFINKRVADARKKILLVKN